MRNLRPTGPKRAVGKSGPSSRVTLVLQAPEAPKQGRTLKCVRPVCEEVWVKLGVARVPFKLYERGRAAGASVCRSILKGLLRSRSVLSVRQRNQDHISDNQQATKGEL
jgi:hypothetical protein